jgi:hypothetical protein
MLGFTLFSPTYRTGEAVESDCERILAKLQKGVAPMTTDTLQKPAPRQTSWRAWFILLVILAVIAWEFYEFSANEDYITKSRLSKVVAAMDPVKSAILTAIEQKKKLPTLHTAITSANQGKPATADWAELGFADLPMLPREANSLTVTPEGEIVVVLANLGEDMDNTEVRAKAVRGAAGTTWGFTCTSADRVLKQFFHC